MVSAKFTATTEANDVFKHAEDSTDGPQAIDVRKPEMTRNALLRRAGGLALGLGVAPSAVAAWTAEAASAANRSIASVKLTNVSLQLDFIKNIQFSGILWGLEKGYYRDEGIALTVFAQGTTTDPVTLVASGHSTIGMQSGDVLILAHQKGIPVKTFAADLQISPSGFLSLKAAGITKLKDIRGKVVGFPAAYQNQVPLILSLAGLTPKDVKLRTVGFDPSVLVDHQVDVFDAFATNQPIALSQQGIPNNFILWADYGYVYYTDAFFVTDTTLTKNPSLLKAFVRATQRGWADVYAHPSPVVDLIVSKYGQGALTQKQQLAELAALKPLMNTSYTKTHGFGAMNAAQWQRGIDLFAKFHVIPKSFPASDLFVEGFVKPM